MGVSFRDEGDLRRGSSNESKDHVIRKIFVVEGEEGKERVTIGEGIFEWLSTLDTGRVSRI